MYPETSTAKITPCLPIPDTYPVNISDSDPMWKGEDQVILQPHHVGPQQGDGGGVVGVGQTYKYGINYNLSAQFKIPFPLYPSPKGYPGIVCSLGPSPFPAQKNVSLPIPEYRNSEIMMTEGLFFLTYTFPLACRGIGSGDFRFPMNFRRW